MVTDVIDLRRERCYGSNDKYPPRRASVPGRAEGFSGYVLQSHQTIMYEHFFAKIVVRFAAHDETGSFVFWMR